MATVATYLNFPRTTEEAFTFYASVFKTEFSAPILRFGPHGCGGAPLPEADQQLVMHVCLPILGGHLLMGTDAPESMGRNCITGTNVFINLMPDTKSEADALFAALSAGGSIDCPMQDMFWGDYFGTLTDRFGIQWMINCPGQPATA